MDSRERDVLIECAAALRGEIEARIEGQRNRLHEISQVVVETLLALAQAAEAPASRHLRE